ncbi:MAG TPA: AraC family transcriptional regulator [Acidobacteria bacterium]|nr:AraC family transcriptional regulator [Acidobacteriota bacterium]
MSEAPDFLSDRPESTGAIRYRSNGGDVLADVLGTLRLRSRVFCRSDLRAPWAMTLRSCDYAHFHVVEQGNAWLRLERRREALPLATGDLVIVPHGRGHTLADTPDAPPVPLERLPRQEAGGHYVLRHGGSGAATQILCGAFELGLGSDNPVLAALPPVLHVPGQSAGTGAWLGPLLQLLLHEARQPRPGTGTILTRLTDVIFVQAVRVWLDAQPEGGGGWLGALRDPQVGAALAHLHREPERDWSVTELAAAVGLSRSPFAARFRELVGEPPLTYLTRWRMRLAASLLRDGQLTLRELAERSGYESEAAFSKAFKRQLGLSPRTFRQRAVTAPERPSAA